MRNFLPLLLVSLLLTLITTSSWASRSSVTRDYHACAGFLKQSPAQQRKLFRKGALSFGQLVNSCRALTRKGLKRAIAEDADDGSSSSSARSCVSSMQCSGSYQNCLNGTCQDVNGANYCGAGGLSCTPGENCVSGRCQ